MALVTESYVFQIGEAAGAVWHALDENGPTTFAKLITKTGLSRDAVMQAIGWLAREEKIEIDDSRTRKVSLRKETA